MLLLAFYSTLILFFILFLLTFGYLIYLIKQKKATGGNVVALSTLLIIIGSISGIYGFDFYQLKAGQLQTTEGQCVIEFKDNGNSIARTTVEIDGKEYQIKGEKFKDIPDGTYQCKLYYLPVTKNIESIEIEK